MARTQQGSKPDSDTVPQSSSEENISTDNDTTSGQSTHGKHGEGSRLVSLPTPNPEDDENADYIPENEDSEIIALDTSRTKSNRTGKRSKQAKINGKVV